jgi:histidinol dehydrogenase
MRTLIASGPGFGATLAALLAERAESTDMTAPVAALIARVRDEGDAALIALTAQFDRFSLTEAQIQVSASEIEQACAAISAEQHQALALAAARIEAFHAAQMPQDLTLTDAVGARMGLRWGPLDAVGIYVPGGKASYPSSVMMNAIPARVAGVARIAMCVPTPDGQLNPLVLAAAQRAGVSEIYRIGGAQAIAALAYGTATIAPVDRITGPGNAYVAEAKRQVFGRVGIDNIAGPSEVAIIADATQNPDHIALDLLAQAEHDEAAQAILLTDNADLARRVAVAVEQALRTLPREAIARRSINDHGAIILVDDLAMAAALSNQIAPEHLQIMTADPGALFAQIRHAGAVFLGRYTPEAMGDYIAGPNHVLPTSGTARFASGLSVFDFLKRTSWVALDAASLRAIGPAAVTLADAEGLGAHARSVAIRLGQNHP